MITKEDPEEFDWLLENIKEKRSRNESYKNIPNFGEIRMFTQQIQLSNTFQSWESTAEPNYWYIRWIVFEIAKQK
jgi:hypothetical protein